MLLSIVDPWDVKVASVDPIGLAERRGVSLSVLPSNQDEGASQEWPTLNRSLKIPSPWYKPGTGSSDHVSSAKSEKSTLIDPIWLDPWYSPRRYPQFPIDISIWTLQLYLNINYYRLIQMRLCNTKIETK